MINKLCCKQYWPIETTSHMCRESPVPTAKHTAPGTSKYCLILQWLSMERGRFRELTQTGTNIYSTLKPCVSIVAADLQIFVFHIEFLNFHLLHFWLLVINVSVTVNVDVNIEILQRRTSITLTFRNLLNFIALKLLFFRNTVWYKIIMYMPICCAHINLLRTYLWFYVWTKCSYNDSKVRCVE